MTNQTNNIHGNHQVFIQPKISTDNKIHMGLYCYDCVHTHGKKRGNHHWITWITHEEALELVDAGVLFIEHDFLST